MVTGGTGSGDVNEAYSVSLLDGLRGAGFSVASDLAEAYSVFISEQNAVMQNHSPRKYKSK